MTESEVRTVSVKKHEQGFELFKESEGRMSNVEIAKRLGVSDATVRKWKSRYEWLEHLGIEQDVTSVKQKRVTKKKIDEREVERTRVVDAMNEAGTYSPAFDLLIEIYLDAYMQYASDRKNGIAEERQRKELARLLKQLGLDITNKVLVKNSGVVVTGKEHKQDEPVPESSKTVSDLDKFRQRRKGG